MHQDIYQSYDLFVAGKHHEALAILDTLLLVDSNDAEASLFKGNLLVEIGKSEEARPFLFKAKSLLPHDARPDTSLARLFRGASNPDEEKKYLQSAAGKSLSDAMKRAQGLIAFSEKRYQEAEKCFLMAAALSTVGATLPPLVGESKAFPSKIR